MWTRKELKENAKIRFKANYWKCVLAGLILVVVLGGSGSSSGRSNSSSNLSENIAHSNPNISDYVGNDIFNTPVDEIKETFNDVKEEMEEARDGLSQNGKPSPILSDRDILKVLTPLVSVFVGIIVFIFIFATCVQIFAFNPLVVGGRKFFVTNHDENASIKEFGIGFSKDYLNVVLTMFLKDLYTFLWGLLLIIPGIVKSYEYRMIPYLLAENPEMDHNEAFEISKKMMTGNKWKAFVLDLSFIGWHILNLFTLRILGLFYVNPYVYQTDAELYIKLKGIDTTYEDTEKVIYDNYIEVE